MGTSNSPCGGCRVPTSVAFAEPALPNRRGKFQLQPHEIVSVFPAWFLHFRSGVRLELEGWQDTAKTRCAQAGYGGSVQAGFLVPAPERTMDRVPADAAF